MGNTQLVYKNLSESFSELSEPDLSLYSDDSIRSRAYLESLRVDEQYRKTVSNLFLCGRYWKIEECPCGKTQKKTTLNCHTMFCKQDSCVTAREIQARKRLQAIDIKSKRLYHFSIGSSLMSKQQLERAIYKWVGRMRKVYGYKLLGLKVFDIGRKHYEATGNYWYHFHLAMLPEKKLFNVRQFITDSRSILDGINTRAKTHSDALFNNIGWRSKNSVLSYFAKRVAGKLGHKKEGYYYLPDIMNLSEYLHTFYRKKTVSYHFPEGLIYITGTSYEPPVCIYCHEYLEFVGTEIKTEIEHKPPPDWLLNSL
jgi:hypothetical protein